MKYIVEIFRSHDRKETGQIILSCRNSKVAFCNLYWAKFKDAYIALILIKILKLVFKAFALDEKMHCSPRST